MCKHKCFAVRNVQYLGLGDRKDPVALRIATSCSYSCVQSPGVFAVCRAVGLIPKDLGFAPCACSPPSLSSASDRGTRRLWELVGLSLVTLSISISCYTLCPDGPRFSYHHGTVTSWLIITSDLLVTQLRKFWHFYGPSSSNFSIIDFSL